MANNLNSSPVVITAAMAGSFRNYLGPKFQPSAGRFKIVRVIWTGAASGNSFTIKDGDPSGSPFTTNPANTILTDTLGATPVMALNYELGLEVADFMVTAITGGTLQIVLAPVE